MLKRTLIVLSLTLAFVIAAEPLRTVHGIAMTNAEWMAMNAADSSAGTSARQSEGRGNSFVRALKAPFKALGRLFGRGKKDNNKLERISEKDIKKFESVPATQVSKSTPVAPVSPAATAPAESATTNASNTAPAGNPAAESAGFASTPAQAAQTKGLPYNQATQTNSLLYNLAVDHLERGRELLNNHDLNGAIGELSKAASANPNLSEASSLLGVAYWRKGLRDLAEKSFANAVRLNKKDSQILNNFGFLLYENGDYEKATKQLKRAAKLSPSDPRIWNNLGMAQSERGNFDDAYKSFARAQGEYKGHLNIAARLEHHGKAEKAIKHLEKALALQPNSTEALARLAVLYDREDQPEKAQVARTTLTTLRTLADAAVK